MSKVDLDLASIRKRLADSQGPEYWRSLEELANTEEFQAFLESEFPQEASAMSELSRRDFLKLMGASLALAGLNACTRQPSEKIIPYVDAPEQAIPGKPLFFATAATLGGFAHGVLVESHTGRPTKIEGNPDHPASLGATDAFTQASILSLYDPDRSRVVRNAGLISTWDAFLNVIIPELESFRAREGAGLRVLTETVTSPTLAHQLNLFLTKYPKAKWHQYEPVNRDNSNAGARLAFGEPVNTIYRFDKAERILALDADFLSYGPGNVRYARDFAAKRRASNPQAEMNRLYVVESAPTNTGAMADHRLSLRASEIEGFAFALARELGVEAAQSAGVEAGGDYLAWIRAVVDDLQAHRGASVVTVGEGQPPTVHALAHAMNHALGNVGQTVIYTDPVEANPSTPLGAGPVNQMASLQELVNAMDAGEVEALVIIGGNPVYNAPADLRFAERLNKVRLRVHLSLYDDETSHLCHWHIPATHYLEAWSDARAYDGTTTIMQPLIAPLYNGKSAHELLAVLNGQAGQDSYSIVRDFWRSQQKTAAGAREPASGRAGERGNELKTPNSDVRAESSPPLRTPNSKNSELKDNSERFWQVAVHDGVIAASAFPPKAVELKLAILTPQSPTPAPSGGEGLEIIFQPDPTIWDGRFANNGWLQELPKPLTRLTWDTAALISPATAERLGLANTDVVELRYKGRTVEAPVWILPGCPNDSVTAHLGYGRTRSGGVGTGAGFNAYALQTADAPHFSAGLQLQKTGKRYPLASTQHYHSMQGRRLVRTGTIEEYRAHPEFVHETAHTLEAASMFPEHEYTGYAWGMAIDLNVCIGCNACVVACQAENNVPVVGKQQVIAGREMHWIRVDRYYKGNLDNPETYHQPVPCMHCENAPCEVVCPVGATIHGDEGLNEMVYNRCVGTRYCSNNCPYKVRRFNFFQYADRKTESLKMLNNPDVTVRNRGIMEKCTYCVQRINAARIEAKNEDRRIRDGEVITACQAACPTQAIVFGDINDPNSEVSKRKAEPLNYGILTELNTKPRTTYLAKLTNPSSEKEGPQSEAEESRLEWRLRSAERDAEKEKRDGEKVRR